MLKICNFKWFSWYQYNCRIERHLSNLSFSFTFKDNLVSEIYESHWLKIHFDNIKLFFCFFEKFIKFFLTILLFLLTLNKFFVFVLTKYIYILSILRGEFYVKIKWVMTQGESIKVFLTSSWMKKLIKLLYIIFLQYFKSIFSFL